MKNAHIAPIVAASILAVSLAACTKQQGSTAPSAPAAAPSTATAAAPGELARDVVFQQKVACSNAARAFGFTATSPRNHPYVVRRNCYSATLNSCIVEYAALDESATIFDALTGEVLVEYLNFPGNADQIRLASRVGPAAPPVAPTATSTAEEGVTPQRLDYERWSAHLFEGCAH